jgi:hypothetical protein
MMGWTLGRDPLVASNFHGDLIELMAISESDCRENQRQGARLGGASENEGNFGRSSFVRPQANENDAKQRKPAWVLAPPGMTS